MSTAPVFYEILLAEDSPARLVCGALRAHPRPWGRWDERCISGALSAAGGGAQAIALLPERRTGRGL